MLEPEPYSSAAVNGGTSFRRARGQVSFRLLCHASRVGGVIGKGGSIIKQLQQESCAKIRVDESAASSGDRVIIITAWSSINRRVVVDDEEIEVSAAQEAVVRVFERILDVAAETNAAAVARGLVSCRLLAEPSHAGSVIGKGGKVVEKIKKDTGSKIKVLNMDRMPACSNLNDEMIEIEGDFLAVKKALIAVTRRLQDCPPVVRGHEAVEQEIGADGHMSAPPVRSSVQQPMFGSSFNHASGHTFFSDADKHPNMNLKTPQQEVMFRILCSNERVGAVIGKGGTIVRALQNESGASINVGGPISDCEERLVTITANENAESRYSPAQNAVVLVFNRLSESGFGKGVDLGGKGFSVTAEVVVPSYQVGCLLGKGGAIISEMRRVTGAFIRIVGGNQAPDCVSENDQVVQITGDLVNVQEALFNITGRLRENQFSCKLQNGAGTRNGGYQQPNLTQIMGNLGLSNNLDGPPPPKLSMPQTRAELNSRNGLENGNGLNPVKDGLELGSGNRAAVVTNTTVEIAVPENVIGAVYGENGSNLTRLRQISGAKVTVHNARPGTSDRVVIISGSPDEIQAAQSLLQAFILTGLS